MPVYTQTYRAYDGKPLQGFRWWVMVKQELRVLFGSRAFVYLLVMAVIHTSLRVLQITVYDMMSTSSQTPALMALRNIAMMQVDERTFFDYLRIQSPLVFIIMLFAGSGMICNDFRDNLIEIYFSKPLTRLDYIAGKVITLVLVGALLTAIPDTLLVLLHNLLSPGWETLRETYWIPFSIAGFSACIVLPCALGVLASSALFSSERYAGIAVFMILFANSALGTVLPALVRNPNFSIVSLPMAVNRVGETLFAQPRKSFSLHWGWPALVIVLLCAFCSWAIASRIRRAERAT
ncbi:MAG TPA: ABC transporter permease subunit [Candidatus Hydrogenedentes bacterium]|nr:ABC transporter permease subunit [Candidatus Hydrogenedentota bacterium]HPJ98568.1 ABC transporter permease subunit [Candidatus Hydrogenedentota bacterium]